MTGYFTSAVLSASVLSGSTGTLTCPRSVRHVTHPTGNACAQRPVAVSLDRHSLAYNVIGLLIFDGLLLSDIKMRAHKKSVNYIAAPYVFLRTFWYCIAANVSQQ